MGATHRHEKMRAITHCPVCQTEFFVTAQQLDQHHGQVRCGHCLHVFDAKAHSVGATDLAASAADDLSETTADTAVDTPLLTASSEPLAEAVVNTYLTANTNNIEFQSLATAVEVTAAVDANVMAGTSAPEVPAVLEITTASEISAVTAVTEVTSSAETMAPADNPLIPLTVSTTDGITRAQPLDEELQAAMHAETTTAITREDDADAVVTGAVDTEAVAKDEPAAYFDYLTEDTATAASKQPRARLIVALNIFLLLLALMQSLYFLRNSIAIYYPGFKPYLEQACHPLGCSIDLPQKIELIIIDDSDMQEDAEHAGLINFTSTLINQAEFHQAYPNVELTLTDVDDQPTLRRVFKPSEYLPASTNIATGIAAAAEVRIKLAITVAGMPVAGYRVFVTY